MTNRREFLAGSLAALVPRLAGAAPAPRVEAVPTLFHGHPEGQTTLVRFLAAGVDAPAARLRVLAANGRLLGTAGLVRRGDVLAGELWLPLTRPITVRSDLESPATRGVHRTSHRLTPTPRWTIRWVTVGDPDRLRERLAAAPLLLRGAEAALLADAGVRLNPWSPAPPGGRDHLDLLRVAVPAARVAALTGVPVSTLALVPDGEPEPFLLAALAGSGLGGTLDVPSLGDPVVLGLDAGRARMAPRVEAWLGALGGAGDAERERTATVVGTDPDVALRARPSVEEWNGLYAWPRVVAGPGDVAFPTPSSRMPGEPGTAGGDWNPLEPLARLVSPSEPTLAGLARRFRLPASGILVFNPSPFGRSGVVRPVGGAARIVTDVPGLGYAFLPDQSADAAGPLRETTHPVSTDRYVVRLDEERGAIASLVDRATGRELVAPGGALNALDGAVATHTWVERVAGVGVSLVARRMISAGAITSRVTVYDALPWADVENAPDPEVREPLDWHFDLAQETREAVREVPGGGVAAAPPLTREPMVRWLALRGAADTVLVGSESPVAVTLAGGPRLTVHARRARAVLRIALRPDPLPPDDPWRFGFGMLPLPAVRAPGTGDRTLPTFGRLLDVADPAVAVLTIKPADDGTGLIAYLMALGGPDRPVALRPGVLTFDSGVLTDLTERDRVPAAALPEGGILVPIPAGGYAAVRLLGVRVAE